MEKPNDFNPATYDNPGERWESMMDDAPTVSPYVGQFPGCEGCMFAEDDIEIGNGTRCRGFEYSYCAMYEDGKPEELRNGQSKCPNYEG